MTNEPQERHDRIFGREIDQKLEEIVWLGLTMNFSWGQKLEVRESGLTAVQEYIKSLGVVEFGGNVQPKEVYDDEGHELIRNPMAELKGTLNISPRRCDRPKIQTCPFLLIPKNLALKIKVLGCLP